MAISRISAEFVADVSGLKRGTKEANEALRSLESVASSVDAGLSRLKGISDAGIGKIGPAAALAATEMKRIEERASTLRDALLKNQIGVETFQFAMRKLGDSAKESEAIFSAAAAVTERYLTADQRLARAKAELNLYHERGAISAETYARALADAEATYSRATGETERATSAERARQALLERGRSISASVATAEEKHAAAIRELRAVYEAGGLSAEDYGRAQAEIAADLYKSSDAYAKIRQESTAAAAAMREGEALTRSMATAEERYAKAVEDAQRLLRVGAINQQTFNRAVGAADAELARATSATKDFKRAADSLDSTSSKLTSILRLQWAQVAIAISGFISRAISGLRQYIASMAQVGDETSKFARRTGISYAEMAGLGVAARRSGVEINQLATAMSKADKRFVEAMRGSQSAREAFDILGLSLDDLAGMTSAERLEAIADAIMAIEDPAKQAAAAMKLFEETGINLLPALQGGAEVLRKAREEAERLGLALTDQQGRGIEAMNDSLARAYETIQGFVLQVVAKLAPAIQWIADKWYEFVTDVGIVGLADKAVQGIAAIVASAQVWFESVAEVWRPLISAMGVTFSQFGSSSDVFRYTLGVFDVLTKAFSAVIYTFAATFKLAQSGISAIVSGLLKGASQLARLLGAGDLARDLEAGAEAAWATYEQQSQEAAEYWARAGAAAGEAASAAWNFEETSDAALARWQQRYDEMMARLDVVEEQKAEAEESVSTAIIETTDKIAKALDVRTTSGFGEMLRLMYGSKEEDVQKRQLSAQEKMVEKLGDIDEGIEGLSVEAFSI